MNPFIRMIPHNGTCKRCGRRVAKGQIAWYAKHFGVVCLDCGVGATSTSTPVPAKAAKTPKPYMPKGGGAMTGEKSARKCVDGVWRYEFASVGEAVRDALDDFAQNDTSREFLRERLGRALSGQDNWANYFTQDRFLSELSNPSKHLLEAVDRMREHLIGAVVAPTAPRRKVRRGQDWGEELDVDRFLARDPSPWDRSVREKQPRRTVTIGVNLAVNACIKPEELLYRGAAALALADVLTSRGVNVGIVLFHARTKGTSLVDLEVTRYTLKDPLMPLDLGAAAFAMCEIAWFRIVGALGGMRHLPGKLDIGFGSAANLPAADRAGIDYLVDADVLGEEQATEWLKGCLANQETEVCHV